MKKKPKYALKTFLIISSPPEEQRLKTQSDLTFINHHPFHYLWRLV